MRLFIIRRIMWKTISFMKVGKRMKMWYVLKESWEPLTNATVVEVGW